MTPIEPTDKLYVITRADLSRGYQAVQGMHAALDFAVKFPRITENWNQISNYLCFLSVGSEEELRMLYRQAQQKQIASVLFREPDIGNQATALALAPGLQSRELCDSLQLALR